MVHRSSLLLLTVPLYRLLYPDYQTTWVPLDRVRYVVNAEDQVWRWIGHSTQSATSTLVDL